MPDLSPLIDHAASLPPKVDTGFTWTSLFTGGQFVVGASTMTLLGLLVKQVLPWRKQTADVNEKLIETLTRRVDVLEKRAAAKDRAHYIEIRRLDARNTAQSTLDRHKHANLQTCMNALLRAIEVSPEKAQEAARLCREDLERWRQAEQLESARISEAEIAAVAQAERELADQAKDEA